jgi:hypothetical protein
MSISKASASALTIKQLIFICVLAVFSVLLSALVLFCFSRAKMTSDRFPYEFLSQVVPARSAQT